MREPPAVEKERLLACLQSEYDLAPSTLEFLPTGLDYNAGVYRLVSMQKTAYLLKATSRLHYEASYLVPAYLHAQGISSVVAPIPTKRGMLWVQIGDWTVALYPWASGESSFTGMTDMQWEDLGSTFQRIHKMHLPDKDFASLHQEHFDPTDYTRWIQMFEAYYLHMVGSENVSWHMLRSCWLKHRSTIHAITVALEKLALELQKNNLPFVICHADLHPGNLIRDREGRVFVIDWDEVMLAPKERDFIFIEESPTASEALPETPAFFQGYGTRDIDWTALAYYRYERVIQDVIACSENVRMRDDLGEESRLSEAQLFQNVLAEGGMVDAAIHASTHLASHLVIPIRKQPW